MGYAKELPISKNERTYDGAPPAFISNQSQSGVPLTSSVLSLNDKTTLIELMVVGPSGSAAVIGKWGTASVTGSNFDIQVNAGQVREFVVPQSVMGNPASVAGANVANGLYNSLSLKTVGPTSSVFSIEY